MNEQPRSVSLFLPCLADIYFPEIGAASIKVLHEAGLKTAYPRQQTCCGQWALNLGRPQAARILARHFIQVFESAPAVVCPSGSCVITVRRHYPELFAQAPAWRRRAEVLAEKTYELTDFLVNVLGAPRLGSVCRTTAVVHDSCHPLRGLGLKEEPRLLLGRVRGLTLVEMEDPEICCGFGGAFMAKYSSISSVMARRKIEQAQKTGAELMVLTEPGCMLNIKSVLETEKVNLQARHLVEVLASGLGGGCE